jgi:hypothetical protein
MRTAPPQRLTIGALMTTTALIAVPIGAVVLLLSALEPTAYFLGPFLRTWCGFALWGLGIVAVLAGPFLLVGLGLWMMPVPRSRTEPPAFEELLDD